MHLVILILPFFWQENDHGRNSALNRRKGSLGASKGCGLGTGISVAWHPSQAEGFLLPPPPPARQRATTAAMEMAVVRETLPVDLRGQGKGLVPARSTAALFFRGGGDGHTRRALSSKTPIRCV